MHKSSVRFGKKSRRFGSVKNSWFGCFLILIKMNFLNLVISGIQWYNEALKERVV